MEELPPYVVDPSHKVDPGRQAAPYQRNDGRGHQGAAGSSLGAVTAAL